MLKRCIRHEITVDKTRIPVYSFAYVKEVHPVADIVDSGFFLAVVASLDFALKGCGLDNYTVEVGGEGVAWDGDFGEGVAAAVACLAGLEVEVQGGAGAVL
jgi:hypothetical protein